MRTVTVVDYSRIGKKGFPMHPEAYPDIPLPMKEVPVEDREGENRPASQTIDGSIIFPVTRNG